MTERKTTGASKLIEIIKEVYDTKKRMKATINKFIETNSDDFEEYATLTHNVLVKQYNTGYKNGYLDGWHMIFESATVPESQYSDGYREYATFTPSIPQYSTDTNIDNLVDIMKDNYRCRVLLKGELNTSSDEFVIYPDLLEEQAESAYQDGYDTGFEDGYNDAVDFSYTPPSIYQSAWGETVTIVNNAGFGELYYWVDDYSTNKIHYTGPFTINHTCTIHAFMQYNDHVSQVTTKICFLYSATEFGFEILEDVSFTGENKLWIGQGKYGTVKQYNVQYNDPNILYRINLGEWTDTGVSYDVRTSSIKDVYIDIDSLSKGDVIQFKISKDYVGYADGLSFAPAILDEDGTRKGRDIKFNAIGNIFSLFTTTPFDSTKWDWSLYEASDAYNIQIRITPYRGSSPYYGDGLVSALHLVLPADTVLSYTYYKMFQGQSNLVEAPLLPAITLSTGSYNGMFENCAKINYIECLATSFNQYSSEWWLSGVSSTGTFTKASGVTWPSGDSGIPTGWTVVDAA